MSADKCSVTDDKVHFLETFLEEMYEIIDVCLSGCVNDSSREKDEQE